MNETMNLQDAILKEVRREKVPVTLFLMNGFQLRGIITGFDSFVVLLVPSPPRICWPLRWRCLWGCPC